MLYRSVKGVLATQWVRTLGWGTEDQSDHAAPFDCFNSSASWSTSSPLPHSSRDRLEPSKSPDMTFACRLGFRVRTVPTIDPSWGLLAVSTCLSSFWTYKFICMLIFTDQTCVAKQGTAQCSLVLHDGRTTLATLRKLTHNVYSIARQAFWISQVWLFKICVKLVSLQKIYYLLHMDVWQISDTQTFSGVSFTTCGRLITIVKAYRSLHEREMSAQGCRGTLTIHNAPDQKHFSSGQKASRVNVRSLWGNFFPQLIFTWTGKACLYV